MNDLYSESRLSLQSEINDSVAFSFTNLKNTAININICYTGKFFRTFVQS